MTKDNTKRSFDEAIAGLEAPVVNNPVVKSLSQGANEAIDIRELMSTIRSKIKIAALESKEEKKEFVHHKVDFENNGHRKAGELVFSEDLRFINQNFDYSKTISDEFIVSHRKSFIGKIIIKFKKWIFDFVFKIFKDYLKSEKDCNSHVVRFLNDLSTYIDDRDASNFWELSRKVEAESRAVIARFEQIHEEYVSADFMLRKELRTEVGTLNSRLNQLDGAVKGVESIIANLKNKTPAQISSNHIDKNSLENVTDKPDMLTDWQYLLFENRFRGSEFDIKLKMQFYADLFKSANGTVLEIGAGRGELQKLFKEQGIASYGVDLDQGMIEMAKKDGADVRYEDGLKHLENLPDGSLAGIVAIQLVEHLPKDKLLDLIKLSKQKLKKGGIVAFETINPKSVLALSSNYYRDITHVTPLHPDTLTFLMEMEGLKLNKVQYLSPVSDESKLSELPQVPDGPGRITDVVRILNFNIKQLNDLLYGFQDYCIICQA